MPSTLVTGASGCGSLQLAYDGGELYWADPGHGTIHGMAVGRDGGAPPVELVTGHVGLASFKVRGGNLYWIETDGDGGPGTSIVSLPSGATATKTLLSMVPMPDGGPNSINALVPSLDGNTLYFAAGTRIYKIPSAGDAGSSGPTMMGFTLGPELGVPTTLAVDDSSIYYVANTNIELMPLSSTCSGGVCSACTPDAAAAWLCPGRIADGLAFAQGGGGTLAVRGGSIYWDSETSVEEQSTAGVFYGGLADAAVSGSTVDAGLTVAQFPASMGGAITGFAVGAATVYYGEDGFIQKLPDPPGANQASIIIARNQPTPSSFALDGSNLYWTTSRCDIMTMANSP
jgi:hypothetical protein